MAVPSPQTWTLRFKSHKSTILLHVDPLNTFATIKTYLYHALQETGLRNPETGESIPLPASSSDIQLGRPVNINDAHEGFGLGEWEYTVTEDEDENDKGKGKAKATAKKADGGSIASVKDCPKGAGLKDGAVLAFRWAGDGTWDGDDAMDGDADTRRGVKGADMWGVKLASFEDAYGVDNETDVGGGREFEG
jgi:hypothetical protein